MDTYTTEQPKEGGALKLEEKVMKTSLFDRWSWQFSFAIASMIALMLLVVVVSEAFGNHALGAEAQGAWKTQLERVEQAVSQNDLAQAALLWRDAYAAALRSRHWEGMVAGGDAYRRLGDLGGFRQASQAKAREIYLAGLFRARQEGSLDGVLRVAEAFAELGDHEVVEHCVRSARSIAAQARDTRGAARVRAFAERWEGRALEVEQRSGLDPRGGLR